MKKLLFLLLLGVSVQCTVPSTTTFILVRHAEKEIDGTKDPDLTNEGKQRAENLRQLLSETAITGIYSTNFKRTLATVEPLAAQKNIAIQNYSLEDPDQLLRSIIEENPGGTVVISGHSNTTPKLANELLGKEKFAQFEDADYGNILVIEASKPGTGKLVLHLRY